MFFSKNGRRSEKNHPSPCGPWKRSCLGKPCLIGAAPARGGAIASFCCRASNGKKRRKTRAINSESIRRPARRMDHQFLPGDRFTVLEPRRNTFLLDPIRSIKRTFSLTSQPRAGHVDRAYGGTALRGRGDLNEAACAASPNAKAPRSVLERLVVQTRSFR